MRQTLRAVDPSCWRRRPAPGPAAARSTGGPRLCVPLQPHWPPRMPAAGPTRCSRCAAAARGKRLRGISRKEQGAAGSSCVNFGQRSCTRATVQDGSSSPNAAEYGGALRQHGADTGFILCCSWGRPPVHLQPPGSALAAGSVASAIPAAVAVQLRARRAAQPAAWASVRACGTPRRRESKGRHAGAAWLLACRKKGRELDGKFFPRLAGLWGTPTQHGWKPGNL